MASESSSSSKPPGPASTAESDEALFGMPAQDYYTLHQVTHTPEDFVTSRGLRMFTQSWLPNNKDPVALLFLLHGLSSDSSWHLQLIAITFASVYSIGVLACDLEGHGRSEGHPQCYFSSMDAIVSDCHDYYCHVMRQKRFAGLRGFVYGESLGASICVLLAVNFPTPLPGIILACPFLNLKPEMQPSKFTLGIINTLAALIPKAPIIYQSNLSDKSFSDPRGYERCIANPYRYVGSQRLQVVKEMLRLTRQVQDALPKVTCPWLILHGEKDEVTDPEASKQMYAVSPSQDKTLHLVVGALHQLMAGEPPPVRDGLIKEVAEWVIKRGHAR